MSDTIRAGEGGLEERKVVGRNRTEVEAEERGEKG